MFNCKEDNRRRSGLRQDYLMPQTDISTSQIDELFMQRFRHPCGRPSYQVDWGAGGSFPEIVFEEQRSDFSL